MLNNANEWYSYYLKVFVVIIEPKGSHFVYIFFKNMLTKFAEIFDSQKITKKTKSSFLGSILTRFFNLLEKFHNRKWLDSWAQKVCFLLKLTFSDLVEITNFEHFEFCPMFWRKMLNNANEWYSYYLRAFVVICESKEATLNIIFFKICYSNLPKYLIHRKWPKNQKAYSWGAFSLSFLNFWRNFIIENIWVYEL